MKYDKTRKKTKELFAKIMAAVLTALFCMQYGTYFDAAGYVSAEESGADTYAEGTVTEGMYAEYTGTEGMYAEYTGTEVTGSIIDAWSEAADELALMASSKDMMAVVYLTSGYDVKTAASSDSDTVITVRSGQTVYILGTEDEEYFEENYESTYSVDQNDIWYLVSFFMNDICYTGYVQRYNLAVSDEIFIEWEENTFNELSLYISAATDTNILLNSSDDETSEDSDSSTADSESVTYEDIEAFPESYKDALYALKKMHPDWIFVALDTGLNWDTSVTTESSISGNRSWIQNSNYYYHASQTVLQGSWYYAAKEAVAYYMDPRNFLNETRIFMFEQQSYNASYHTVEGVETMLSGTFMDSSKGNAPGTDETYAQIIYEVGKELNVSPYSLASRIIQEQGRNGNSALISGTYSGYEGYYNYFNVGASGTTDTEVIANGLSYAESQGWTDAKKSISGGASTIAKGYIAAGQDTVYLEKFNVAPSDTKNVYGHQYMQNIQAPYSESYTTKKQYENAGCLDKPFVFKIPVYDNMPAYVSPEPQDVDFTVVSASFDGSVTLNFYVYFPSILKDSVRSTNTAGIDIYGFYVCFWDADGKYKGVMINDADDSYYDFDTGYYKFTYELSAKDMTKQIECSIIYRDVDSSGAYSGTDSRRDSLTLSVQDYMGEIINNPDDYADYVDTAKALLCYGGAAQRYFNYNTDNCADSILDTESGTDAYLTLTENDIAKLNNYACRYADNSEKGSGCISFYGASLLLDSNISVKLYFGLSDDYLSSVALNEGGLPESLSAALTDEDSENESLSISVSGNIAVVTVSDIDLKNWGNYFNVELTDTADGVSYSVDYCPLSFCSSAVQSGNATDALKTLSKAMLSLYES